MYSVDNFLEAKPKVITLGLGRLDKLRLKASWKYLKEILDAIPAGVE